MSNDNDQDIYADIRASETFKQEIREAIRKAHLIHGWGDGYGGHMINVFTEIIREEIGSPESQPRRYTKKSIDAVVRKQVFERDKYRCRHCGDYRDLTVDHIIPESKGGAHELENFQTLCRMCNSKKGVKNPQESAA